MDEIGILPQREGTVVRDGYSSYAQYPDAEHALCNVHHLRHEQEWAGGISGLLFEIKEAVEGAKRRGQIVLADPQLTDFEMRYDRLVGRGECWALSLLWRDASRDESALL